MEQMHFMILLMMFFSVIGSWHMNQKINQQDKFTDQDSVSANEYQHFTVSQ